MTRCCGACWCPRRAGGALALQHEVTALRQQLEQHVAKEEYEEAAKVRDRVRALEKRLGAEEYLAGEYSIADISTFPWVRTRKLHRRDLADYPNIDRWYHAIKNRPGVHTGLNTLAEKKTWEAKPGTDEWTNMFGKN